MNKEILKDINNLFAALCDKDNVDLRKALVVKEWERRRVSNKTLPSYWSEEYIQKSIDNVEKGSIFGYSDVVDFVFQEELPTFELGDYVLNLEDQELVVADGLPIYRIYSCYKDDVHLGQIGLFGTYSSWETAEIDKEFYEVEAKQVTEYTRKY